MELALQNTTQRRLAENVLIQCISDYSIKLPVLGVMLLYLDTDCCFSHSGDKMSKKTSTPHHPVAIIHVPNIYESTVS